MPLSTQICIDYQDVSALLTEYQGALICAVKKEKNDSCTSTANDLNEHKDNSEIDDKTKPSSNEGSVSMNDEAEKKAS
jgi:hypothetical protein